VWYTGVIEHATLTAYPEYGIAADDPDVVKGRAGSPYSIRDYYDVSPDLAVNVPQRMNEFEQLVARTHTAGLKVIIDFVPNHVARKYQSDARPPGVKDLGETDDNTAAFKPSNNFYYLPGQALVPPATYNPLGAEVAGGEDGTFTERPAKATGNDQFTATPRVDDWFDSVKLNYGVDIQQGRKKFFDPVPDTWLKMKDILIYWASKNIDGFRCDMAEMVPVEFWEWAIPQVKAINANIVFIAEIYNPAAYRNYIKRGKFDFLYDKVQLYDTLRLLTNGQAAAGDIARIQSSLSDINAHMLHFLENHDEQRIASRFFAGDAWKGVPGMVVTATIDTGPVLIYFGQEVGEPGAGSEGFSGDDGRTTLFDYWGVPEHQKWMNNGRFDGAQLSEEQKQLRQVYAELLTLAQRNAALADGDYADLTLYNIALRNIPDAVSTYCRFRGEEKLLVVASFSTKTEHIKIEIPPAVATQLQLHPNANYIARDLLSSGLELGMQNLVLEADIGPYSAHILKIK
jgi:glycosidase